MKEALREPWVEAIMETEDEAKQRVVAAQSLEAAA